ncbi:MAG: DinB family protein [Thermomicrobiales bacterium]|nr:DinB family protein [Thermomicrobiales bacterium]
MTIDTRTTPPFRADEKSTLLGFLQHHRETLLMKCKGLTDDRSRPDQLSPTGRCWVWSNTWRTVRRYQWFQGVMDDRIVDIPWHKGENEFDLEPEETSDSLLAFYAAECAISDEIVAQYQMDDLAQWYPSEEARRSLRWIVTHMIRETARHCGHADIIREAIDGATGE